MPQPSDTTYVGLALGLALAAVHCTDWFAWRWLTGRVKNLVMKGGGRMSKAKKPVKKTALKKKK